jgi:hypothetical protein
LFNLGVRLLLPKIIVIAKRKLLVMLGTIFSFTINDVLHSNIQEISDVATNAKLQILLIKKIVIGGNQTKRIKLELNEPFQIFNMHTEDSEGETGDSPNKGFRQIKQKAYGMPNAGISVYVYRPFFQTLLREFSPKIKDIKIEFPKVNNN